MNNTNNYYLKVNKNERAEFEEHDNVVELEPLIMCSICMLNIYTVI